jgi:hypothetical protein
MPDISMELERLTTALLNLTKADAAAYVEEIDAIRAQIRILLGLSGVTK